MTFRDDLTEWCDWDDAAYALGNALHVFDDVDKRHANGAIMTANDFGKGLHRALEALVKAGVLEHRDDPDDQFRWAYAGPEGLVGARSTSRDFTLPMGPADLADQPKQLAPVAPVAEQRRWWQRGPLSPS